MSSTKKIIIIFLCVFLSCILGAAVILGVLISKGGGFESLAKLFGADISVDESRNLDLSGITAVRIECASSDIHLATADKPKADLKGYVISPKPKEKFLNVLEQNGTLVIKVELDPFFFNYSKLDLRVYLPEADSLDVTVNCKSGDIDVSDMRFGDLKISHTSGNTVISNCAAVAFSWEGSSGDTYISLCSFKTLDYVCAAGNITVKDTSGDFTVRSTAGNVNISGASGSLDASCLSGNITAQMTKIAPVTADVTSGNITLFLPSGSAFDLTAKVTSGSITSDMDIKVSGSLSGSRPRSGEEISGTCNGGGVPVDLSTISGNIYIYGK